MIVQAFWQRRLLCKGRRWRRSFLKRITRKRKRGYRIFLTVFLAALCLYLASISYFRESFLSMEEKAVEFYEPGSLNRGNGAEVFRLIFRLKSGEIVFCHERMAEEEKEERRN